MTTDRTPDLLVTGASGKLGQAVLSHLLDTLEIPASRIAAASRKPAELGQWTTKGVTVRQADFDDPGSLDRAFSGIGRVLIISTDAVGAPGKRLAQHKVAIEAASRAGVSHIVYTSMPHAETSPISFAPDHWGTEQAIAASGVEGWSILRNTWYAENLFLSLPGVVSSGTWYSAAGDGGISYIERDDLALAAAVALASDFSGRRTLTLNGSKPYTAAEIAELATKASGKKVAVLQVPLESLVQGMVSAGLPEPMARTFASFDAAAKAGTLAGSTDDFSALTGQQPKPFDAWFAKNAAVLVGTSA